MLYKLAPVAGFEPATYGLTVHRSTTELNGNYYSLQKKWCPEAESNHRHGDFQSPALPTELSGQYITIAIFWSDTRGSNSLPQPWQGCALPNELVSQ